MDSELEEMVLLGLAYVKEKKKRGKKVAKTLSFNKGAWVTLIERFKVDFPTNTKLA